MGLSQVKNTYRDVDDYLSTFEPLLFEEVKAQIIQKKDDEEGFFFPLSLCLFLEKNLRLCEKIESFCLNCLVFSHSNEII